MVGFGVLIASASDNAPAPAQTVDVELPPEGATYVGSDSCFQCHSQEHREWSNTAHPTMVQDAVANPAAILADFSAGEDVRTGDINGETRAYTAEDVAFTLGSQFSQRYVAQTADGGYEVLPGVWKVADATWVAADSADWLNDCAGCHTTGFNVDSMSWSELSVGCEACHGPGSTHVETARALPEGVDPMSDDVYALRSTIVRTVDSAVCGQCHTRGMSPDGAHPYPVGYVVGGPLDETMFIPASPVDGGDDYWWPDGSERDYRQQYLALLTSKHGGTALATLRDSGHGSDNCMACHSTDFANQDRTFAQDAVTIDNAQFSITCVQCHSPHGDSTSDAMLAGEAYDLCVSCHTGTGLGNTVIRVGSTVHHPMREMFEGTSFLGLDPNPSPHFSNEAYGPICSSCHMTETADSLYWGPMRSHTFRIVLPTQNAEGEQDACTACHDMSHDDMTPDDLYFFIEDTQQDTQDRVAALREDLTAVTDAHPEWDPQATDKSDEQVMAERIQTLVSFVEADGSWGFHNPGYTDDILSEAEDTMSDLLDALGM